MTTFDRYLLHRYLYAFGVLFVSLFGLFVVIDGFTNVDSFQEAGQGIVEVLTRMAVYYTYQLSLFFDMVGTILSVISVMIVFAVLQRHSEIHPLLAAGVPTRRLMVPVVLGMVLVNLALVGNQELVIPRISHRIQASRGEDRSESKKVQPIYDHSSLILIGGSELFLESKTLKSAKFVLPANRIAHELTTLKASEATFYRKSETRPAGWHLRHVTPRYDEIGLTSDGRKIVRPMQNPDEAFIATDVSFDQLYNRSRSFQFLSTPDLIDRIKNPAHSLVSVRGQTLHLHNRLMKPLSNIVCVLIVVPLILRRESSGLVTNMAVCTGVLGMLLGMSHVFNYLGQVNLISLDLAVWAPFIFAGTLGAWLTGVLQT